MGIPMATTSTDESCSLNVCGAMTVDLRWAEDADAASV
jgi:hypothetical protein